MLLIIPSATWLHEAVPLAWVTCGPVPAGCCLCGPKKWLSPNCSSHHVRPLSFVDFKPCTTGILTDVLRWKRIINSAGSQKGNIYLVKKTSFGFFFNCQCLFWKIQGYLLPVFLPLQCSTWKSFERFTSIQKYGLHTCFLPEIRP